MKLIFLLSGDYIEIGREEVSSLLNIKNFNLIENILIADLKNEKSFLKNCKRLALTKKIYRLLFKCKIDDLADAMKNFGWDSVYQGDFCLRINYMENNKKTLTKNSINVKSNKKIKAKKTAYSEKILAGHVWRSVKNPKVALKNPKTLIQLFIIKNKVYCGLLVYENKEDFEARKAHLRPFPHSSSLHPKLARALVNISEIGENKTLFDPFCGTGGFLIESGLMGIKSVGYDISKIMANGCKKNLEYFKIKGHKVKAKNALKIGDRFDYAVTDLPYGLNSNAMAMYEKNWKKHRINRKIETKDFIGSLEKFYLLFLGNLRKKLKKKAVIVFPSYVNYRLLLKKSKFMVEFEYEDYMHRSLKRKIVKVV
ncbi:hypothetical protein HYS31_01105 [Candidatus Woesearchaeota archaeon]|nr:hypothetical protein [Candidatus Woesearchaeota archaeon]